MCIKLLMRPNKQNDENQELFDQGKLLGRLLNKVMKKYNKSINKNQNQKETIGKLETMGFGFQKTKFDDKPIEAIKENEPS